jgi:Zn-dependent M32 family carboxypeptidase
MKKLILIVMALLLAACASVNALGNQSEIEQNQAKWQDAGISHYRYDLSISCFCVFTQDMPLIIEVQDGKVVSMQYKSGKEIDPSLLELFEKYATIDRTFAELKADLNGAADEVIAKYDPTHGFPTEVKIDVEKQATDDELYLSLSNFEKLP